MPAFSSLRRRPFGAGKSVLDAVVTGAVEAVLCVELDELPQPARTTAISSMGRTRRARRTRRQFRCLVLAMSRLEAWALPCVMGCQRFHNPDEEREWRSGQRS